MNRYYLISLAGAPARLQQAAERFEAGRLRGCDRFHARTSRDGSLALVQGEITPAKHTQLVAQSWCLQWWEGDLGGQNQAPQELLDYLAANQASW